MKRLLEAGLPALTSSPRTAALENFTWDKTAEIFDEWIRK